jgi:peptidoglycan hydrolase CwlO-like protein
MIRKILIASFLLGVLFFFSKFLVTAQNTDCQDISDLKTRIECINNKISDLQGQKKTLASQIGVMSSQISLTEARIKVTKQEIAYLVLDIDTTNKKILTLQGSLNSLTQVLLNRIVATYEAGRVQPFEILLASDNVSSFVSRLNYLKIAQAHDKKLIYATQQAKNDYANQKEIFEAKKKKVETLKSQLEAYTIKLAEDKHNKEELLNVTKNDEARYQRLLAQAQAERAIVFGGGQETFMRNVSEGDSIGFIVSHNVSPGCSTGAHLHFEVQKNGSVQDPNNYLKSISFSYSYEESLYGYYGTINPTGQSPWPINEPITINQGYGSHGYAQTSGVYAGGIHTGIDIDSSSSTVKAVKSGKLYGGSYNCSNGKLLYAKIEHDDGLITWYLHMLPE